MNGRLYNLSNPQKSIWMTEQFYKGSNINNITGYLRIDKNTNFQALEKAFNIFVIKNDSFKTKITTDEPIPKQYFEDFVYENIEIIDLKTEAQLLEFESSFPMQCIETEKKLLFRTKMLRFTDGSGILALIAHHLIADGWTMSLVLNEIYNNYIKIINNEEIDLEPNPSYIDFIKSQQEYMNGEKYKEDSIYWQEQFKELPNAISFKDNTKTSINTNRKIFKINKGLVEKIDKICKKNKISYYIFLLSIYNIYFSNIFNSDNFVIGNPVLNRANFKEKKTAGMFVSIMPFIVNVDKNKTFIDFCQKMLMDQKKMYRHLKFPYHDILDYVRKVHNSADSLYDIIFSYQNASIPSFCKWLPNHSQAESLQIHIKNINNESEELSIHYDFLTDIFSEQDINMLHERIMWLIKQILHNPDKMVADLEVLPEKEKKKILKVFNNTKSGYKKNSNIVKEFEKIVQNYPKHIAVMDKNNSYTYEELNEKANFLAKKIIEQNQESEIIAFALKRSCDIIITILAILKSGHTYMPIDVEYPIERVSYMLENSKTKLLITTNEFYNKIDYKDACIYFDEIKFEGETENLNIDISPQKLSYIMYTSGSTGTPKAVTIRHYNVLNFVKSMQEKLNYIPSVNNRVISVTTVCFDIFVFEIFPTLLSGLTLFIADELESRSPKLLSAVIKNNNISKILTTPSRIELLFSDSKYLDALTTIKEFILGGEPLPSTLLKKLQEHTKAKIYNLYGPTETTVYSTFKDVTDSEVISIGKPINNTQIYILNNNNNIQPIGSVGEICIGGDGVGAGYYNNPEKTKEVFIKNPNGKDIIYKTGDLGYWRADGELMILGRKDHQIKIRGYRVELDDISNNIIKFEGIEKCVVVDKTDKEGKKYLVAYLVSRNKIDKVQLKKYLVNILPHYMIPSYFMQIDKIPLTVNHKVDRKSLPEPNINEVNISEELVEPNTEVEKRLCEIFENCLSISKIGITNDIFDYNLDSLEIIKIQTKMLEYNYKINTQAFYQCRTIEKLAKEIEEKTAQEISEEEEKYLADINNSFYKHPSIMQFKKNNYRNVLLLGATGFLGIHFLKEIIEQSSCKITCILRKKEKENDVKERIKKRYEEYFNIKLPIDRLHIIDADITTKNFGLSFEQYKNLGEQIDLVINTAANVRYYGEYKEFKKINVDAVSYLVEFCVNNNIQLIHTSTLGVSGDYLVGHKKNYNDFTENDFYIKQRFNDNVYIRTKFEAEKLIYENILKGLNASIIRVGNLTGRYKDGVFQQNVEENAFYNILRMILKFKIIPNTMEEAFLEFTPVDECARAMYKIIFNMNTNKFVFHLFNENYIQIKDLIKILKTMDYNIKVVKGNDYKDKIMSLVDQYPEENILKGIVNDLDDNQGLSFNTTVNKKNFYTDSCLEKLDFSWQKITDEYIEKIIKHLKIKKYLK